jgi:hypothetical protein
MDHSAAAPEQPSIPMVADEIGVSSALNHQLAGVQLKEQDRLRFARHILLFLFLTCTFVFAGYYLQPDNRAAAAIFELVKIGVLPLITLVIGFYFPSSAR